VFLLLTVGPQWLPEAKRLSPETPIFVVGCKKDLRFDGQTIEELQRSGQLPLITAEVCPF